MNGFRETEDKKDCVSCKHFISWYDFMGDGDELEPSDLGKCENEKNDKDKEELDCGEGNICDLWDNWIG